MAEALPIISNLGNPLALAGLALLIPIILLYLLKPKPKLIKFPSTMFIRFIEKNKRFTSFLQRFIHDPLLVMQLLIITLLVLALAAPFFNTQAEERGEQSVAFVIDASASMHSTDSKPTRFESALSKAREIISGLNERDDVSLVLAENIPVTVAAGTTLEDALTILSRVEPADTPSNVGDAIMLARDLLSGSDKDRVIYVLSDFAGGRGLDPQIARKIALMSGIDVEFIKVGARGSNTGIIGLDARRSVVRDNELYLTASVRNYHPVDYTANLRILSGTKVLAEEERTIESGGEEFYYFSPNITSAGQVISAELVGADDLPLDDIAYAYVKPVKVNRILLLTSEGQDRFLRFMLESLENVDLTYAVPPVTPDVTGFDVIILGTVRGEEILPGTFRDIGNHVGNGASLVIVASEPLAAVQYQNLWSLMPVDVLSLGSRETEVIVTEEHTILQDVVFDNVVAKQYYNVRERDNQTVTIVGSTLLPNPLIAYREHGKGYVVYMGLNSNPDWSNLYYSSSFPIFWSQMIKYVTRPRGSDVDRSLTTGEYLHLPEASSIKTPSGRTTESKSVFLDKVGVYRVLYEDRTDVIPVNLFDGAESNTTGSSLEDMESAREFKVERELVDVKVDVFRHILILFLAALLLETILYRRRGLL